MGIQILNKTKEDVGLMDAELQNLKPILDQKKRESEELTIVVEEQSKLAETVKE